MSQPKTPAPATYRDAGVDIDAGDALVERIKPFVRLTKRPGADTELGGFGGLFDPKSLGYKDPILVSGTDGVGTKLEVAKHVGRHGTVGIDLVAMVVNDLVVQGAEPLFFLDYFASGKLNVEQAAEVIRGITEGCREAGCALIGGETAEMPGLYQPGDYDLAGFAVGMVERSLLLPRADIAEGDLIIGLASSGVHSNGFSLVRHLVKQSGADYKATPPGFDKPLGEALLAPTRIYIRQCLPLAKAGLVKAMAHITGGGITENLPRVLPEHLSAELDCAAWNRPPVFHWLQKTGNIAVEEMLRTFNCGLGMALVIAPKKLAEVRAALVQHNEPCQVIGSLVSRGQHTMLYENIAAIRDA